MIFTIFLTFAKIGLFTFGGGYAMISIIENICVERKKWITHEEMMDVTVIAESTPGPIAINCATFVGYKQKGIWGGLSSHVWSGIAILYDYLSDFCFCGRFPGNYLDCKCVQGDQSCSRIIDN